MSSYEWKREQLDKAGLDPDTHADVLALILVWEKFRFVLDDPRKERILSVFTDLARDIAIERDEPGVMWVEATKAKPRQHDRVRIKRDAFPGERGRALNGREGIIARVSRGTLVVAIDNEGSLHVAPEKLETRVPVT